MRNQLFLLSLLVTAAASADTIFLRNVEFDPAVTVPRVDPKLKAAPTSEPAYYLVSLNRKTSPAERARLESATGADIIAYVPQNSFVVRANGSALDRLQDRVAWVGRFEPAYKLANDIGIRQLFSPTRQLERAMGQVRLTVTLFDEAENEQALLAADSAGFEVLAVNKVGPRWVLDLRGLLLRVQELAHVESIGFIEESSDRQLRNNTTTWVIQSNQSGVTPIWNRGVHGENQVVGLIDTGVYRGHNQFRDPIDNVPGPNHRKLIYYSSSNGINSSGSHGTHTAGTLAGDQSPITGSTFRNGIAYAAKMAFTEMGDVFGGNLYGTFVNHWDVGARVHSNSWGDDGTTAYTSDCQQIDQYSWDHETGMVAFAVTNTSTLKTPENAKSVLAVGATNQAPSQHQIGSGGRGPTTDGRRKPEIFAPGIGISSARNNTVDQWRVSSGTSMACPAVTGAGALVRQYLESGYLDGIISNRNVWSGAMVRAILMNTTTDMAGAAGYPSVDEGWGRLLMANAMSFGIRSRKTLGKDVKNANGFLLNDGLTLHYSVYDSSEPLRVTMTFTDYPAQVFAGFAPVNDVDLEVVAPDGVTVYKGNVITNGQSQPGGTADAINSTEMVILNNPPVGTYEIRTRVRALNQGQKQGMAVVVNGKLL